MTRRIRYETCLCLGGNSILPEHELEVVITGTYHPGDRQRVPTSYLSEPPDEERVEDVEVWVWDAGNWWYLDRISRDYAAQVADDTDVFNELIRQAHDDDAREREQQAKARAA